MACFHPLRCWQLDDGRIVFAERGRVRRSLEIPCGQCVGCRLERSRQWAVRCMHEASLYSQNCFITLTYREECLPEGGSLRYRDFQLFLKRLRKEYGKVRFYMCGEYGELLSRPHYHACLFGVWFDDSVEFRRSEDVCLYTSERLSRLWPHGFSLIGHVTFDSAAYVARYVMKKITGPDASAHYTRLIPETGELVEIVPEFNRMSLRPGIGRGWFDAFGSDVFPHDYVVVGGRKAKPPRYYDKLFRNAEGLSFDGVEFDRAMKAAENAADCTAERLQVREVVTKARLGLKHRSLE